LIEDRVGSGNGAALFAHVAIDTGGELLLDYRVPAQLIGQVVPGSLVNVPLGRRPAKGIVLAVSEQPSSRDFPVERIKPLYSLLHERAVVDAKLIELADWVANYYGSPLQNVLRSFVPGPVWKGGIRTAMMEPWLTFTEPGQVGRGPLQKAIVEALEGAGIEGLPVGALAGDRSKNLAAARRMEKAGMLVIEERPVVAPSASGVGMAEVHAPTPNAEQVVAINRIEELLEEEQPLPLLLLGVTGSGKTEVYIRAIERVVQAGQSALLLVPEIALTPQTMERLSGRFASRGFGVAMLHSNLSEGERYAEWCRIVSGDAQIVIGPRSAVFAPVVNLGLIVVDEEHEPSYKQDKSPRYHGRDVSVVRAKLTGCPVVLGSATPSLESIHNVNQGKYHMVRLDNRVDDCDLPLVRVVDLRREKRKEGSAPTIFSEELAAQMRLRLDRGEQTILFLNRRGFARSQQCLSCGHSIGCPDCSVTLTLHRGKEMLLCHICGYQKRPVRTCPECGDRSILNSGYGTERVEDVLHKEFRNARVARIDSDTVSRKGRLQELLDEFKTGKIDILIGTQMIAKGLHFPNVTLVGVLQADLGLQTPDFRAAERVFQLLTQVAGRAGRGDLKGEVIVQAFSPESPAIQFARHQDFDGFAKQELEFRSAFGFPPFSHATLILARSEDPDSGHRSLLQLIAPLKARSEVYGVIVGDAVPAPLEKSHGQFRFQILLRGKSPARIRALLNEALTAVPVPDEAFVTWDMDPYSLM